MSKKLFSLMIFGLVILANVPLGADDGFYVVGAGGKVGTKITSLPYAIKNSGFYFLAGDLVSGGHGITVEANHVTIDLMGFSLIHRPWIGEPGDSKGIAMSGRTNVEIRNGTIRGFFIGINDDYGSSHRIINVRLFNPGKGNSGANLVLHGNNHLVQGCLAADNVWGGIFAESGTISGCRSYGNGNYGIQCQGSIVNCIATNNGSNGIYNSSGTVSGCRAEGNGSGIFVGSGSIIGCVAVNNTNYGFNFTPGKNVILDGNSASDNGTNYPSGDAKTVWGFNAGR